MINLVLVLLVCLLHTVPARVGPFERIVSLPNPQWTSNVTVVCAHYMMKKAKHSATHYRGWWKKTLRLNASYIVYTNDVSVAREMLHVRGELPTIVIYVPFEDFYASPTAQPNMTQRIHVPSVQLGLVWAEKLHFMQRAYNDNYYKSDWFAWVDSGNALYRAIPMPPEEWPHPQALVNLPNKFLFTFCWFPWTYEIAGTAFIYHRHIVPTVTSLAKDAYELCRHTDKEPWHCLNDQWLMTLMKTARPDLFIQVGYGYGDLVRKLFRPNVTQTNITHFSDICTRDPVTDKCTWHIEMPAR